MFWVRLGWERNLLGVDTVLAIQRDGVVVDALVRVAASLINLGRIDARAVKLFKHIESSSVFIERSFLISTH